MRAEGCSRTDAERRRRGDLDERLRRRILLSASGRGVLAVPSPLWRLPVTAIRPIVPLTPSRRRRPARDRWSGVVIGTGTRTRLRQTVRTRAGYRPGRGSGRQPSFGPPLGRAIDSAGGSPVTPDIAALRRCLGGSERPERTAVDRGSPVGLRRPEPTAGPQPNRRPRRTDRQQFGGPAAGGDRRRHASRWRSASSRNGLRCCWSALSPARTPPTRVSPRLPTPICPSDGNRSGVAGGRGVGVRADDDHERGRLGARRRPSRRRTPAMLSVSDGSPRCATALLPGGEVTIRYELRARPGRHVPADDRALSRRERVGRGRTLTTAASSFECEGDPDRPATRPDRSPSGPLVTDDGARGSSSTRRGVPARGPREPDRPGDDTRGRANSPR